MVMYFMRVVNFVVISRRFGVCFSCIFFVMLVAQKSASIPVGRPYYNFRGSRYQKLCFF